MTIESYDAPGLRPGSGPHARSGAGLVVDDSLKPRDQLAEELVALRREYGVLQDMLAQAWIDAGAHGAGEAELRLIVESLPLPVMIFRRSDERVLFASGKLEPLLGIDAVALVGRAYASLFHDAPAVAEAMVQLGERGVVHGHELRMRRADGSLFWTSVSLQALEYRGEQAVSCALVDISERIEMAERLELARQEAESASMAKSTFLAHMSHELRNPLNAIIGYAEMLVERTAGDEQPRGAELDEAGEREALREEFGEDAQRILKVARMQLAIINDSLDLAKIEAGRMNFTRERFRVVELMREVVTAARPLVQRNANLFEVSLGRSLGEVEGDPVRIRQILLNLLGNAAKFTREGKVSLVVRRESPDARADDGAKSLMFRVTDTGIGMSAAEVERLFSPFFQARAARAPKYAGTGLGLSISQQLARTMGGDITVTSQVGLGSTFTLYLPTELPASADAADG